MGYPAVVNTVLDSFAEKGGCATRSSATRYGNQLVDLMAGTLVRAAGSMSREQLRSEIQRTMDLFAGGAFVEMAEPAGEVTREVAHSPPDRRERQPLLPRCLRPPDRCDRHSR